MSELKAISGLEIREDIDYNTRGVDLEDKEWRKYGKELCDTLYYRKSEADKVIADLEESHKMEVEQLLMEIVKLKGDYKEACDRLQTANLIKDEQIAATRHSKRKRCLAMRNMCRYAQYSYSYLMDNESCKIRPNNIDFRRYNKKYHFYLRWRKRWLELANKFKEAK